MALFEMSFNDVARGGRQRRLRLFRNFPRIHRMRTQSQEDVEEAEPQRRNQRVER